MLAAGIDVKFAAEAAGNVAGNLASGIVPVLKLVAFKAEPSIYPAPLVIALLFKDISAEPSKATPAIFLAVVNVAADPVVF